MCREGGEVTTTRTIPRAPIILGQIALIPLTQGRVAIVDAADAYGVAAVRWYAQQNVTRYNGRVYKGRWYACRGGGGKLALMHRELCASPDEVDHINGNGLDNRRANLRPATHAQNLANRTNGRNRSGVHGVSWSTAERKWHASIQADGREYNLGNFSTIEEATQVRDAAAIRLHGEFARLNGPRP